MEVLLGHKLLDPFLDRTTTVYRTVGRGGQQNAGPGRSWLVVTQFVPTRAQQDLVSRKR